MKLCKLARRLNRSKNRSLNRYTTRMCHGARRPRPRNYAAIAVRAFKKAIRSRRRLMKLAPHLFDSGVIAHETEVRAKEEKRHCKIIVALKKVYGSEADALSTDLPERPVRRCSARTLRAIELESAKRELWMAEGERALALCRRNGYRLRVSLGNIAGLFEVGLTLGRLATGLETTHNPEPEEPSGYLDGDAAIEKIYGDSAIIQTPAPVIENPVAPVLPETTTTISPPENLKPATSNSFAKETTASQPIEEPPIMRSVRGKRGRLPFLIENVAGRKS